MENLVRDVITWANAKKFVAFDGRGMKNLVCSFVRVRVKVVLKLPALLFLEGSGAAET